MALRTFHTKNSFVQEILTRLNALSLAGKEITLCWIPSHVGIAGNETADAAAKRAAARPCTRRFPLPATDFRPAISEFVTSKWQETWNQCSGNKLRVIKPTLSLWRSSLRRSRREEVVLCRLRTGHTYATHGYNLCGDDRPRCTRCQSVLTVKHVLLECPQLDADRRRCFGMPSSELTLSKVLGEDSVSTDVKGLFDFLDTIRFLVIYSPFSSYVGTQPHSL